MNIVRINGKIVVLGRSIVNYGGGTPEPPIVEGITMQFNQSVTDVELIFNGSGTISVDWGDGSPVESLEENYTFNHTYSVSEPTTATISGDVTAIECYNEYLENIDLTSLEELYDITLSSTSITELDVSNKNSTNNLNSIYIENCANLVTLNASNSKLQSIEQIYYSNNTSFENLIVNNNEFGYLTPILDGTLNTPESTKYIDISNTNLESLSIYNLPNLTGFIVTGNTDLTYLFIEYCDLLTNLDVSNLNFIGDFGGLDLNTSKISDIIFSGASFKLFGISPEFVNINMDSCIGCSGISYTQSNDTKLENLTIINKNLSYWDLFNSITSTMFQYLETINVSNNLLDGGQSILPSLGTNFPSLNSLNLSNNPYADTIVMQEYESLISIDISNTNIETVDIANNINLTTLNLSNIPLKNLYIDNTKIEIINLSSLTNLEIFTITDNIIVYLNANGCSLAQNSVDNILLYLDENEIENGYCDISGGNNASPIDGTSNTNYLSLISKGWTVNIN